MAIDCCRIFPHHSGRGKVGCNPHQHVFSFQKREMGPSINPHCNNQPDAMSLVLPIMSINISLQNFPHHSGRGKVGCNPHQFFPHSVTTFEELLTTTMMVQKISKSGWMDPSDD